MRFTKWDYLAFPLLAALAIGVVYGALRLVGFFGIGVLGLVIGFIAVRMDLESDGPSAGLHRQFKARQQMSRADLAGLQSERQARQKPLFIAQVVAAGFVILGFGLHFLL